MECKCMTTPRSTKRLWLAYFEELIELVSSGFTDGKEWSDCSKAMEDLVERYFGLEINLGSLRHRVVRQDRLKEYGCMRSERHLAKTGGMCCTEYQLMHQ